MVENSKVYIKKLEELHNTILDGIIEEKRPSGRSSNSFIEQVQKYARIGSYGELKEMVTGHEECRKKVVN